MLEVHPVCLCRLMAGGGRNAPREGENTALWGRLRMPPWVGVEAVWGTITNSSSEGEKILAKLRLCEKKIIPYNCEYFMPNYLFHFVADYLCHT